MCSLLLLTSWSPFHPTHSTIIVSASASAGFESEENFSVGSESIGSSESSESSETLESLESFETSESLESFETSE